MHRCRTFKPQCDFKPQCHQDQIANVRLCSNAATVISHAQMQEFPNLSATDVRMASVRGGEGFGEGGGGCSTLVGGGGGDSALGGTGLAARTQRNCLLGVACLCCWTLWLLLLLTLAVISHLISLDVGWDDVPIHSFIWVMCVSCQGQNKDCQLLTCHCNRRAADRGIADSQPRDCLPRRSLQTQHRSCRLPLDSRNSLQQHCFWPVALWLALAVAKQHAWDCKHATLNSRKFPQKH